MFKNKEIGETFKIMEERMESLKISYLRFRYNRVKKKNVWELIK